MIKYEILKKRKDEVWNQIEKKTESPKLLGAVLKYGDLQYQLGQEIARRELSIK